jgi:branched-chain amino acid transport system ATP-binding protein
VSDYQLIAGTQPFVSLGITCILGGGCACMTGRVLALNWRPDWQIVVYCLLLGIADRFLVFALFQGELLSPTGYLADVLLFILMAVVAFKVVRARQMVRQYPWLYEFGSLKGWRDRAR